MQDSTFYIATLVSLAINLVYTIVALFCGLTTFKIFDKYFLPEIDFIKEIKNGNMAAAIFASSLFIFVAVITGLVLRS